MTFAELLTLLIERRGRSIPELAALIGVDPSYVRRLVAGSRIPVRSGPDLIDRISEALKLPQQQRENLHAKFQEALISRNEDQRSPQEALDEVITRIIGPKMGEAHSGVPTRPGRVQQLQSEFGSYKSLAFAASQFLKHNQLNVFVYLPDAVFPEADRSAFLGDTLENCGKIYHFIGNLDPGSRYSQVIESVFRIADRNGNGFDSYRPVLLPLPGVPAFLASENQVMLFFGLASSHRVFSVSTQDRHVCRLLCRTLGRMYQSGKRFVEFFDERDSEFQERLFDIELISSSRRGVFDEGPSFLTHPRQWYGDNSSFEDRAPWRKMPLSERRKYKDRLRHRIDHAAEFMDIEEIVSEASLLRYIQGGAGGDDFYESAFPVEYVEEHIRHIVDVIRSPNSRYKLFISSDRGLFIENKSWAAYNDYVFFDKVSGGGNQAVIFSSEVIADGFREIFEATKRLIARRFFDANATADWLLARLVERKA